MATELDRAYEEMGRQNEELYKPIISKIYGLVVKTSWKYNRVDFLGENYCCELKSRNLNVNEFDDTMIGYNKVVNGFKKLKTEGYKVYFLFAFKDGLYVWELNKTNFDLNGGDKQKRIGGTSNRGKEDYKDHYYIKKEYLVKIDDTSAWIHPMVVENSKKKFVFHSSIPEGVCWLKMKK